MSMDFKTNNESGVSFNTTFDKSKVLKIMRKELLPQANFYIKEHIKTSITQGIMQTRRQILGIKTKKHVIAPSVIANSLQAFALPHVNQHIRYKVGSYSNFDKKDAPTGARGSRMKRGDRSLTSLYEQGMGRFRQEGTIGAGSGKKGYISDSISGTKEWKTEQESKNKIVVSEKGYGQGVAYAGKNKSGRGVPMIWHPGYERLRSITRLKENISSHMQDTTTLERALNKLKSGAGKHEMKYGSNTGTNLEITSRDMNRPSGSSNATLFKEETRGLKGVMGRMKRR